MKKVLHVVSDRGARNGLRLAPAIEKTVEQFITDSEAALINFDVVDAKLMDDGFGQALITVEYSYAKSELVANPETVPEDKVDKPVGIVDKLLGKTGGAK